MKEPTTMISCEQCNQALHLEKVPAVSDEDSVTLARRIALVQPEALGAVAAFLDEHSKHNIGIFSVEPVEDYRKRS